MITITSEEEGNKAKVHIQEGTPYSTIILGCEMLAELLIKEGFINNIDVLLDEIKRLYERDMVE